MARRRMEFWLTDEARDGIDRLCTRHHVTRTAFVEALGVLGATRDPTIAEIVALARQLDRERRSRR